MTQTDLHWRGPLIPEEWILADIHGPARKSLKCILSKQEKRDVHCSADSGRVSHLTLIPQDLVDFITIDSYIAHLYYLHQQNQIFPHIQLLLCTVQCTIIFFFDLLSFSLQVQNGTRKKSGTKAKQVMSVQILWCLLMNAMVPNLCMSEVNGSVLFHAGAKKSGTKAEQFC